jgi:hypothetical protein
VFLYSYAYKQRRLYWVLPLFIRDNNMAKDTAWFAIPGVYTQRRKGENLDFVQFPLVWHIERGANQGTFGAFAWWDIRVKGRMLQMVPGAFFRARNERRDVKVVGPGLAWWTRGVGAQEGNRSWFALFGLVGGGVENGRRYASVFGARIDRGPAPSATQSTPAGAAPTSRRALRRVERAAKRAAKRDARAERKATRQVRRTGRRAIAAGR